MKTKTGLADTLMRVRQRTSVLTSAVKWRWGQDSGRPERAVGRSRGSGNARNLSLGKRPIVELLVAVVLSAQGTDKSVNLATRELFRRANTPRQILELG